MTANMQGSPVLLPDLVPGAMKPEEVESMRQGNNYCFDQSLFEKPDEIDCNLICSIGFGGALLSRFPFAPCAEFRHAPPLSFKASKANALRACLLPRLPHTVAGEGQEVPGVPKQGQRAHALLGPLSS